jgi:hypothetical protein
MSNSSGVSAAAKTPDLSPAALVYIEKVRQATRRLRAREISRDNSARENVQESLDALRDVAAFDVEVPTASTRREWEYLKVTVKKLTSWYLRYLAGQLNAFGGQVQRLGETLAARTDGLEAAADELAARMELAEERLGRLEAMNNARTTRTKRGPSKDAAVEN